MHILVRKKEIVQKIYNKESFAKFKKACEVSDAETRKKLFLVLKILLGFKYRRNHSRLVAILDDFEEIGIIHVPFGAKNPLDVMNNAVLLCKFKLEEFDLKDQRYIRNNILWGSREMNKITNQIPSRLKA